MGTRHVKSQETPLPVYIGVMHVKTRKKELIDRLHTECMLSAIVRCSKCSL